MSDKKSQNRLVIEGDHDDLMNVYRKFAGSNYRLKFNFSDEDQKEIDKRSVPETQENTTDRLKRVQESGAAVQMAPNLVNHDAYPNDELDKMQRSMNATNSDNYKEQKKQANVENIEQLKKLEKFEGKHDNVHADASKEQKPEDNKNDKGAAGRSNK